MGLRRNKTTNVWGLCPASCQRIEDEPYEFITPTIRLSNNFLHNYSMHINDIHNFSSYIIIYQLIIFAILHWHLGATDAVIKHVSNGQGRQC